MKYPLFTAILIIMLACGLQFWLASAGIFINLILAALIVFAFFFDAFEMAIFVLFAVFVVNWQPAMSFEIVLFILIPFAAFMFHRIFAWAAWAGIPVMIVCGFLILYVAIAPGAFFGNLPAFFADVAGSLLFAELALVTLRQAI